MNENAQGQSIKGDAIIINDNLTNEGLAELAVVLGHESIHQASWLDTKDDYVFKSQDSEVVAYAFGAAVGSKLGLEADSNPDGPYDKSVPFAMVIPQTNKPADQNAFNQQIKTNIGLINSYGYTDDKHYYRLSSKRLDKLLTVAMSYWTK